MGNPGANLELLLARSQALCIAYARLTEALVLTGALPRAQLALMKKRCEIIVAALEADGDSGWQVQGARIQEELDALFEQFDASVFRGKDPS